MVGWCVPILGSALQSHPRHRHSHRRHPRRRHPRRCQWGNRLSELLPRRCHPRYTTLAAAIFALPRAGMPPLPSVACMALHYSLRFVPCVSVWRWRDDRCREDVMYENCMMPDVISVMRRVQWPMLCGGLVLRTVSKCPRSGRFAASKPPLVLRLGPCASILNPTPKVFMNTITQYTVLMN